MCSACHCHTQQVGVAAKVIRITGRLNELFEVADAVGAHLDLVLHLVRDPRALLSSRWMVGWLHPTARTYEATLPWARSLCNAMMDDAAVAATRKEYMLLRCVLHSVFLLWYMIMITVLMLVPILVAIMYITEQRCLGRGRCAMS